MVCPKCKVECRVTKNTPVITGDNSADTATKLFRVLEFTCRNKQCADYGKVVKTIRDEQKFITE